MTIFQVNLGWPVFIEAKDDGGGGDNWSYVVQSSSQIITTNKPTCSFLQVGCPSCHPTNSVKALKGKLALF